MSGESGHLTGGRVFFHIMPSFKEIHAESQKLIDAILNINKKDQQESLDALKKLSTYAQTDITASQAVLLKSIDPILACIGDKKASSETRKAAEVVVVDLRYPRLT